MDSGMSQRQVTVSTHVTGIEYLTALHVGVFNIFLQLALSSLLSALMYSKFASIAYSLKRALTSLRHPLALLVWSVLIQSVQSLPVQSGPSTLQ